MYNFCKPSDLNPYANDPVIFKRVAIAGQENLDLTVLDNEAIGIDFGDGGFVFHRLAPFLYDAHILFRPCRGVLEKAKTAIELMFCKTDCCEIVTKVPVHHISAAKLATEAGLKWVFLTKDTFNGLDGLQDVNHYRLNLWDWVLGNDALLAIGREFHQKLEEFGELEHADDDTHDRFVGFAYHCLQLGCMEKGVIEYNKWAKFTGYKQVSINSDGDVFFDNVAIRRDGEIVCQ